MSGEHEVYEQLMLPPEFLTGWWKRDNEDAPQGTEERPQ